MKLTQIILLLSIIFAVVLTGCSSNIKDDVTGNVCTDSTSCDSDSSNSVKQINVDKLEIYHFYGTHQCSSCIAVGNLAEETVNTYFKDELDEGLIIFDHINEDLSENKELVTKYGVTGSSLWFGTYYKDGRFSAEENTNVWYKINNEEDYMNYLKGIIEQKLVGR